MQFQTTPESQREMDDLCLASEVKASLIDLKTDIEVSAREGIVSIETKAPHLGNIDHLVQEMRRGVEKIPGLKELKINLTPPTTSVWDDPV